MESSGIKEFNVAITAFKNNYKYILNSLKYRYVSNGPTEGFNNQIKVLKRISYGVRNFTYFRNRILIAIAKRMTLEEVFLLCKKIFNRL